MRWDKVIRLLVLRYYTRDRLVSLFVVLGIALGVSGFVSIQLATDQAFRTFRSSAEGLLGSSVFTVSGSGGGLDERIIKQLREIPGLKAAVPFSTGTAQIDKPGIELRPTEPQPAKQKRLESRIKIIGLDIFAAPGLGISIAGSGGKNGVVELLRDSGSAVAPPDFNGTTGDKVTVVINGSPVELKIAGDYLLPPGTPIDSHALLVDISTFQELFNTAGRVDSFEIVAEPSTDIAALRSNIEAAVPRGVTIETTADRVHSAEKITEAFRINLKFLSIISLFVAILLIYNNASNVVLKRRSDFGVLLSLGLKPRKLFVILIIENFVVGLLGAAAGTFLGYLFSKASSTAVLQTISNLYLPLEIHDTPFDPSVMLQALWIGPLVAVAGSVLPLLEIYRIPLRDTFGYQTVESRFHKRLPFLFWSGGLLVIISAGMAALPLPSLGPLYGFVPPTILMFGAALLSPGLILSVVWLAKKLIVRRRPVETALTADHLTRTLRRNSVAVCSAMIALGMLWGLATMIRSFRDSVDQWISYITKADIYVSSATFVRGDQGAGIRTDLLKKIEALPGLAEVDSVRALELRGEFNGVRLIGTRFDLIEKYHRLLPIGNTVEISGASVYVSEPFANRYHVKAGDSIELPAPAGPVKVGVRAVYLDYSSDHGVITIPDTLFLQLYGEKPKTAVSLYLQSDTGVTTTIAEIQKLDVGHALTVRNGAALRDHTLSVFDQTFRITDILLAIALAISLFAIFNAVYLSLAERRRELSVLRAIGASRKVLLRTVAMESLLLGLSAAAGGLLLGGGMSVMLVFVVNRFFFGWSTGYTIPAGFVISGVAGVLLLSILLPLIPAARFFRRIDRWEIRYE